MQRHILLIALDSVGIDPLGHDRAESVYAKSRFLFPAGMEGDVLVLPDAPVPGVLVATDVTGSQKSGAIECAITYTSIFSGQSAVEQHGLMQGIGLKENLLKEMIDRDNLFRHFDKPCLANAIFPAHLTFLGSSFVQEQLPHFDRRAVEQRLLFRGEPVRLLGINKHGFAELFTLAEINQNIFVYAAQQAGLRLRTWDDVRNCNALTSSMTNELENDFNFSALGEAPLPLFSTEEASAILVQLAKSHDFTFYKYQMADLISHTGQIESARHVFSTIERFVEVILQSIDSRQTTVIITSDHGHLEQLDSSRMHPKTNVPTWYFGADAQRVAEWLRRPEGIFQSICRSAAVGKVNAPVTCTTSRREIA